MRLTATMPGMTEPEVLKEVKVKECLHLIMMAYLRLLNPE